MTATYILRSETTGRPELVDAAEAFAESFDLTSITAAELDAETGVHGDDEEDERRMRLAIVAERKLLEQLAAGGWTYDGPIDGDHGVNSWLDGVCFVVEPAE